jgi:hypothetical protein
MTDNGFSLSPTMLAAQRLKDWPGAVGKFIVMVQNRRSRLEDRFLSRELAGPPRLVGNFLVWPGVWRDGKANPYATQMGNLIPADRDEQLWPPLTAARPQP